QQRGGQREHRQPHRRRQQVHQVLGALLDRHVGQEPHHVAVADQVEQQRGVALPAQPLVGERGGGADDGADRPARAVGADQGGASVGRVAARGAGVGLPAEVGGAGGAGGGQRAVRFERALVGAAGHLHARGQGLQCGPGGLHQQQVGGGGGEPVQFGA